jgi:hypothetical protein
MENRKRPRRKLTDKDWVFIGSRTGLGLGRFWAIEEEPIQKLSQFCPPFLESRQSGGSGTPASMIFFPKGWITEPCNHLERENRPAIAFRKRSARFPNEK